MIDEGDNRFQKVKTRNESKRKTLMDKPNPNLTKSIQNVETNETFGSINASKYSTVYDETKGFFKQTKRSDKSIVQNPFKDFSVISQNMKLEVKKSKVFKKEVDMTSLQPV